MLVYPRKLRDPLPPSAQYLWVVEQLIDDPSQVIGVVRCERGPGTLYTFSQSSTIGDDRRDAEQERLVEHEAPRLTAARGDDRDVHGHAREIRRRVASVPDDIETCGELLHPGALPRIHHVPEQLQLDVVLVL